VLLSDGASRLVDPFELATWEELLALLDENGPEELLRQVRPAEAVDAEGRQWPRTKCSDDATLQQLPPADHNEFIRMLSTIAGEWPTEGERQYLLNLPDAPGIA
jgi:hypothetical protein